MVQGQALLHIKGTGNVEWGAIVPDSVCRWITATAPHPMRPPPACHHLLRTVPPLALTREEWRPLPRHCRDGITAPGARYPPGRVLEQLTAPTPRIRHTLHRASAQTKQPNNEVLDLALAPLRVLYPQAHLRPAGTSNRLARLALQRGGEAANAGGVVEQWLTLRNPSPAQGHSYLHQLLFLPQAAPEHRRQDPYASNPERLGAQSFPQPPPPALQQEQGQEPLLQGSPRDATTALQQRGRRNADRAEPGSGGLDHSLYAPRPGHQPTPAVQTGGPYSVGVHGGSRYHGSSGGLASALPAPCPPPGGAAPPTRRDPHANGAPHGGTAVRRRSGTAGGWRRKLHLPQWPHTDHVQHPGTRTQSALSLARQAA